MTSMYFKKNLNFEIEITDIADGGEGIGRIDDFAVFVKDALPGDLVEASFTKVKNNYGFARLVRVIRPSIDRVEPVCPVSRACGGCQLQTLSYPAQLRYKQKKVMNALTRIGGFDREFINLVTEDIIGMEEPYRYRNKAQYPIGTDRDGKLIAGFYAGRTHDIIPSEDCVLGCEENAVIIRIILEFMEEYSIEAYDAVTCRGLVRHVLIRKGHATGEILVCLVINSHEMPHAGVLVDRLKNIPGMSSISVSPNTSSGNVIMGDNAITIWGKGSIVDEILLNDGRSLRFNISSLSFYQVNSVQMRRLYGKALEYASLAGNETVWDLYCGIGTITLLMAQAAGEVCGVEVIPDAIRDARENAALNNISNVSFYVGRAEEVLPEYYALNGKNSFSHPDVIVVDPPRKGCDEKCLSTMLAMEPDRIVYVSCDPATLSRDLKLLCSEKYEIKKICPLDMFPQGVHVETVCLMSRVEGK